MKLARVLILALGLTMIAAIPSFAAVPFVTSSTLNMMAPNAETGLSGNVVLTALAGGTVSAGEIINVSYNPSVISSLSSASTIVIVNAVETDTSLAGVGYGASTQIQTNIAAIVSAGNITLNFSADTQFFQGDQIQIIGVRLDVHGFATVGSSLNVTISSVLGTASLTNPTVPVALFVEPITATMTGITFNQVNPTQSLTTATLTIKEAGSFSDAFETQGMNYPTELIVQVTGLPAGITLNSAGGITTNAAGVTAIIDPSSAGLYASGKFIVDITGQQANIIDTINVVLTFAANGTLALNPAAGAVNVTLGPAAVVPPLYTVAPGVAGPPVSGGGPDLYSVRNQSPALPITVFQQATALLSVFNSWIPPMAGQSDSGFDTGIAISNTSGFGANALTYPGDPWIPAQSGTVTAVLFPSNGGTPASVTTSATVFGGTGGLDANGNIPPHATWTVLLSQLATQAGFTTGFTGQIYFFTNFSDAHGVSYISDNLFKTQAQGYFMLVLPITGRTWITSYEDLNN